MACPDILKFPVGSPQRQAAIDCQMKAAQAKRAAKIIANRTKAQTPTATTGPPSGTDASNPFKAAADALKSKTYRTS